MWEVSRPRQGGSRFIDTVGRSSLRLLTARQSECLELGGLDDPWSLVDPAVARLLLLKGILPVTLLDHDTLSIVNENAAVAVLEISITYREVCKAVGVHISDVTNGTSSRGIRSGW